MYEKLIKKWWFYVIALILAFLPSITEKTVSQEQTSQVIQAVLMNPLIYKYSFWFLISKLSLIILFICPLILKNKFIRIFPITISVQLFLIAIFQNIATETEFGYAVLLGNILIQLLVLSSWIYELRTKKNDFTDFKVTWWKIFCLVLGFFAFWMPSSNGYISFKLTDILLNESGLTYCMVTPFILSILFLYYPKINKVTLRVTSFIGFYFGIMNLTTWFVFNTEYWWMGVLHMPLLINSFVGMIVSKKVGNK